MSAETSPDDLPSIDAIITRTRPVVDRSFHRQQEELIETRGRRSMRPNKPWIADGVKFANSKSTCRKKSANSLSGIAFVEVRESKRCASGSKNLATNLSEASLLPSADTANEREELVRVRAALQRREEELRVLAERCGPPLQGAGPTGKPSWIIVLPALHRKPPRLPLAKIP